MGKPSPYRQIQRTGRQKGFSTYWTAADLEAAGIDPDKVLGWRPLSLGTDRGQIILDVRQGRKKR
jgi:hypothetical protein